jgi:hypothetical protein
MYNVPVISPAVAGYYRSRQSTSAEIFVHISFIPLKCIEVIELYHLVVKMLQIMF